MPRGGLCTPLNPPIGIVPKDSHGMPGDALRRPLHGEHPGCPFAPAETIPSRPPAQPSGPAPGPQKNLAPRRKFRNFRSLFAPFLATFGNCSQLLILVLACYLWFYLWR